MCSCSSLLKFSAHFITHDFNFVQTSQPLMVVPQLGLTTSMLPNLLLVIYIYIIYDNYDTCLQFVMLSSAITILIIKVYFFSAAPPSRPAFGGPSVMTSPGGTPLSSRGVIPITGLNPYQNKWTIKARVSSKPAIRTWSNSRGEGRVFNVDLVDSSVCLIECLFYFSIGL